MKAPVPLLVLLVILTGCITYPYTGAHLPLEGPASSEEKVLLAQKVLAALPPEEIRTQVQKRFPNLYPKQLSRIHVNYANMNFHSRSLDETPRNEVHLVVTVYHDKRLHEIADEIQEFIVVLLQTELERQRRE